MHELYIVEHYWGGDEPTTYYLLCDQEPTENSAIRALGIDFERDQGEYIDINLLHYTRLVE